MEVADHDLGTQTSRECMENGSFRWVRVLGPSLPSEFVPFLEARENWLVHTVTGRGH